MNGVDAKPNEFVSMAGLVLISTGSVDGGAVISEF